MEFLTPIFAIAGGLAATIPVALHMLRKSPTEEMSFSLVRFLQPARPRLTRRSNIEYWPLMLLRMLALLLLGLGFARPFIRDIVPLAANSDQGAAVAILVDKSASMRRDGIRDEVLKVIQSTVDKLDAEDVLTIASYSADVQFAIRPDAWTTADTEQRRQLIDSFIQNYEPDWRQTNTGLALQTVADTLMAASQRQKNINRRSIVLITDFQRGSRLDELESAEWPAEVAVTLQIVQAKPLGNAGLSVIRDARSDRWLYRIANSGDATLTQFQVQPFDPAGSPVGDPVVVEVSPGGQQSQPIPTSPDSNQSIAGIEILNDPHPFDNVIDLPEYRRPTTNVAFIGPPSTNDPQSMRYYLQRVLSGNTVRDVRLINLQQASGVNIPMPDTVKFAVATDIIPDNLLPAVQNLLKQGGTLFVAGKTEQQCRQLESLTSLEWSVNEAAVNDYAILSKIDYDHPLFAAFAEAQFADFSSIRFFQHRIVNFADDQQAAVTVLAAFDDGSPAVLEVTVGQGRIFVLTCGWNPEQSQLALSTRFPPLLTRMLDLADPISSSFVNVAVGTPINPNDYVSGQWTVTTPSQKTLAQKTLAQQNSDGTVILEEPGRFLINGTESASSTTLIASLPMTESFTEPLPVGQLQAMSIPTKIANTVSENSNVSVTQDHLNSIQLERQQKYWRWFLLAGLLCLAFESVWASILAKQTA